MDFISGALPNVMFVAGLIAIGLALGLEFKIVEVKGDLSKQGRIGAFSIGILLIIVSIVLYLRPVLSPATGSTPTQAPATFTPLPPNAVAPANAGTDPTPSPSPAATSVPIDDPVADFRVHVTSGIADGRVGGREGADLIKKLEEFQDLSTKNNAKRTEDRLREIYTLIQDGARKGTIDAAFAQQGEVLIQRIAERYDLSLSPKKP